MKTPSQLSLVHFLHQNNNKIPPNIVWSVQTTTLPRKKSPRNPNHFRPHHCWRSEHTHKQHLQHFVKKWRPFLALDLPFMMNTKGASWFALYTKGIHSNMLVGTTIGAQHPSSLQPSPWSLPLMIALSHTHSEVLHGSFLLPSDGAPLPLWILHLHVICMILIL